jgi:hypothetical protein
MKGERERDRERKRVSGARGTIACIRVEDERTIKHFSAADSVVDKRFVDGGELA